MKIFPNPRAIIVEAGRLFESSNAKEIQPEKWQGLELKTPMIEIFDTTFRCNIPDTLEILQNQCSPDLPWADNHFEERISGIPSNPGNTYKDWPYYKEDEYRKEIFTHTYQERFWPKKAGNTLMIELEGDSKYPFKKLDFTDFPKDHTHPNNLGIRYPYGDLKDLINHLSSNPTTRQAYLPIWFPEDTGVVHEGRVPCTLGYLFSYREGYLHITYYLRSCDYIRHFKNDIYLAIRLLYFVLESLKNSNSKLDWNKVKPGRFTFHIQSLHIFKSDLYELKKRLK